MTTATTTRDIAGNLFFLSTETNNQKHNIKLKKYEEHFLEVDINHKTVNVF